MKKYIKLIVLSITLVVVIALVTLAMIYDVDVLLFKNLSISGIQAKKIKVEDLMAEELKEQTNNLNAKENLKSSKDSFEAAKEEYENIPESTIEIVQEATKDENYFIEYLWIVLGNYAEVNNLDIGIATPGSTLGNTDSSTSTGNSTTGSTNSSTSSLGSATGSTSSHTKGIKIVVEGRYANVADFVFDVENDKSLRFKLDNIQMSYIGNNSIKAYFDILSLDVLK